MSKLGTLHHRLASSIVVVDETQASRQAAKAVLTAAGYQQEPVRASRSLDFGRFLADGSKGSGLSFLVPHLARRRRHRDWGS